MSTLRGSVLLALMLIGLSSCKKEVDYAAIDLGYDYFPNKVGSYITYEVDSIYYGITQQVFQYQLKEVLSDVFLDDSGQPVVRVERFLRHYNTQPWISVGVWTQKRTGTTAEKVENNRRVIKMEFPIAEGGTWHGNAYNNGPDWIFTYRNYKKPANIGTFVFPNTVRVEQRNMVNLVDQEIAFEVYAHGIGMIQKQFTDISYQGGVASGFDVRYTAIDYNME